MAFGDVVKSDDSAVGVTTQSCDLGSNPASGNLLIFASSNLSNAATITTPPSGFTELQSNVTNGNLAGAVYYKISVGTEQTAEIVWSSGGGGAWYLEYDFDGQTLDTASSNEDTTNVSTVVTSQSSGAVTPTETTNLAVAVIVADDSSNCDAGQSWTNSFVADQAFTASAFHAPAIASKTDVSGSTSTTFSTTDTGDEMWGVMAIFEYVAAGGGVIPQIMNLRRQMAG